MSVAWGIMYTTPFDERSIASTARSLASLRTAYADYVGLMRHWRQVSTGIAGRITRLANEDLIEDPEAEMQRIFTFCNLGNYDSSRSAQSGVPLLTSSYLQARGNIT